jgi:hypothetical protein
MSGALYDLNDDGTITVSKDGQAGQFDGRGKWLSGAIRTADPQLCGWMAGSAIPRRGAPA